MVAWHEVPGKVVPKRSVPEGRYDWRLLGMRRIFATSVSSRFECRRTHWYHACMTRSYRPYGTGHNLPQFQALRARLPSLVPSGLKRAPFFNSLLGFNPLYDCF